MGDATQRSIGTVSSPEIGGNRVKGKRHFLIAAPIWCQFWRRKLLGINSLRERLIPFTILIISPKPHNPLTHTPVNIVAYVFSVD